MAKISIAVIAGGYSSEREISLNGAAFFSSFLNSDLYDITIVDITHEGWFAIEQEQRLPIDKNDFSYTLDKRKYRFDLVITIIHGTPGENGQFLAYLDLIGMPYLTGSVVSSAVSFDKEYSKAVAASYGVKVAESITLHRGDGYDIEAIKALGFPQFIKPNASGSSYGVSKVKGEDDIEAAIKLAFEEDDIVLIERGLSGREYSKGAYSLQGEIHLLPATEIVTSREFFDYEAKYLGESNEITPAQMSPKAEEMMAHYTRTIYKALRCRGVVRIDYIVEGDQPYMIEINNVPGMSSASIIPQQVKAQGLDISELYDRLIADCISK